MSWGMIGGAAISTVGGLMASRSGGGGGSPRWLRQANRSAIGRAEALSNRPYHRYTGERVAPLDMNERLAGRMARNYGSALQPYFSRLRQGVQFDPSQLSQFENPYLDRVLSQRQRVIGEEYGRQSANLARNQSAMDAFRTGRSDLARSRLENNRMLAMDDAEGEARAAAFDQALRAYQQQQQLGVQSDLGALQAGIASQNAQIGALGATGATRRGIAQAQNDFDYGQFLEGRDWDVNNFGTLLDALRVAQGIQPGSGSGPSTASMLTGLLGTAMSNGAFNGLFGGTSAASLQSGQQAGVNSVLANMPDYSNLEILSNLGA